MELLYLGQASIDGSGAGGSARVKAMVEIFNQIGIRVNLISYAFHSDTLQIEHRDVSPLLRTVTVHVPSGLPKIFKTISLLPMIYYAMKWCRHCDVIFADFITIFTSLPAVMLKKVFKKYLVLDFIDVGTENHIDVLHTLKFTRRADLVFAISHYLYEKAKEDYRCRNVVYVPIFVDESLFKMDPDARKRIRQELGIRGDEIVLGYVGSFWQGEGIPNLISAFKKLRASYPNLKLAIMGKHVAAPNYDNVSDILTRENLSQDVILVPPQPHGEVPHYLSAFDILCCPKIDCEMNRAANPVKVMEYLSMGLPSVCSAVGEIQYVIDNGTNGFLVPPGDVDELCETFRWIIENPEESMAIGENGRKKVIQKYGYEAIEYSILRELASLGQNDRG